MTYVLLLILLSPFVQTQFGGFTIPPFIPNPPAPIPLPPLAIPAIPIPPIPIPNPADLMNNLSGQLKDTILNGPLSFIKDITDFIDGFPGSLLDLFLGDWMAKLKRYAPIAGLVVAGILLCCCCCTFHIPCICLNCCCFICSRGSTKKSQRKKKNNNGSQQHEDDEYEEDYQNRKENRKHRRSKSQSRGSDRKMKNQTRQKKVSNYSRRTEATMSEQIEKPDSEYNEY